jgi:hypothetical protein
MTDVEIFCSLFFTQYVALHISALVMELSRPVALSISVSKKRVLRDRRSSVRVAGKWSDVLAARQDRFGYVEQVDRPQKCSTALSQNGTMKAARGRSAQAVAGIDTAPGFAPRR